MPQTYLYSFIDHMISVNLLWFFQPLFFVFINVSAIWNSLGDRKKIILSYFSASEMAIILLVWQSGTEKHP